MSWKQLRTWALLILATLCVASARAQDAVDAPKPAMGGDNTGALQSSAPTDIPDTRPLSGVQNLSLGSQSTNHSFLLPSFGATTQVQFRPNNSSSAGNSTPASSTYFSGRLALNKISARSDLFMDYLASGGFSSDPGQGNSVVQSLDLAESIRSGRWSHMFGESFMYLPSSSFNFGGMGGLGNLGVSLGSVGTTPGFRQDLIPNQSILTTAAARISNATFAQTTYALGYRSSLTFFGAYGALYFLDSGLQNNSSVSASGGYNYLLSPFNSMSVSYGFSRFMFAHLPIGADSHSIQLSFARRITGRMSFQIGAGPDIQIFSSPLAGPKTFVGWALNAGLNYQLRRWQTRLNYSHSLAGGSGVLPVAETDAFSGYLDRGFGSWQGGLTLGYARNQALRQTSVRAISPQGWFASAQVSRGLASFGSLYVSYNVSGQSSLTAVCLLPACGTSGLTQTISVGYNWGFRPIVLE